MKMLVVLTTSLKTTRSEQMGLSMPWSLKFVLPPAMAFDVLMVLVLRMLLKVLLVLGSKRLDQSRWALGREGQLLDNWCDHRAFPQTISTQIVQLITKQRRKKN